MFLRERAEDLTDTHLYRSRFTLCGGKLLRIDANLSDLTQRLNRKTPEP